MKKLVVFTHMLCQLHGDCSTKSRTKKKRSQNNLHAMSRFYESLTRTDLEFWRQHPCRRNPDEVEWSISFSRQCTCRAGLGPSPWWLARCPEWRRMDLPCQGCCRTCPHFPMFPAAAQKECTRDVLQEGVMFILLFRLIIFKKLKCKSYCWRELDFRNRTHRVMHAERVSLFSFDQTILGINSLFDANA